jgi:hypothetical protein
MTINSNLLASFRYWRSNGRVIVLGKGSRPYRATEALEKARADMAAGTTRYPSTGLASYQNLPGDRGGRWIENPEAAGLRFVGFSDELRDTRDSHTGWFLYPEGDPAECARGAVYQLPSRGGRSVYVEAIRTGEHTRGGWRDMGEDGSAYVFLNARHLGEVGGEEYRGRDHVGAFRDAAHGADREAEIYADAERDYHKAYAAGQKAAEYVEEAAIGRAAARELVAELRAYHRAAPGFAVNPLGARMCTTIREAIRQHIRDASKAARKAATLRADYRADSDSPMFPASFLATRNAFCEGFGG